MDINRMMDEKPILDLPPLEIAKRLRQKAHILLQTAEVIEAEANKVVANG